MLLLRRFILWFLVLSFAHPLCALAETRFLLINAGSRIQSNHNRYYRVLRRAYEVTGHLGKKRAIMAMDKSWKIEKKHPKNTFSLLPGAHETTDAAGYPLYPEVNYPATHLKDLENAIHQEVSSSGEQKISLVIFIAGHGDCPQQEGNPATATLKFMGNDLSYAEMAGVLKKFPQVQFKIASQTCYAGGVHYLARTLNNVCSSAGVPYFTKNYDGSDIESLFGYGFWQEVLKSQGATSLAKASLKAFEADIANDGLGSLSSFDFVDYVLKKGPYQKNWEELEGTYADLSAYEDQPILQDLPALFKNMKMIDRPSDYQSSYPPLKNLTAPDFFQQIYSQATPSPLAGMPGMPCHPLQTVLDQDQKNFLPLQQILSQLTPGKTEKNSIFHQILENMKKNFPSYRPKVNLYDERFSALTSPVMNGSTNPAELLAKLWTDLRQDPLMQELAFNHQMMKLLEKMGPFSERATPEQKQKFFHLLNCEWEAW